jgi:predicted nuclease of restriction endonuclease-like (RecB) superfamily
MRNFYLTYHPNEKLAPLVREISWTKDVLINQLEAGVFERYMANQTNFDKAVPEKYRHQAKLAVKDESSLDFLELDEKHSEKELELALLENARKFLVEMGGYFTFVGNQHRLEIDDQEFFIDLLLYHRQLRCLVAIELKVGAFKPEYAGKMQFYLSALNDRVKLPDENSSIGIILCKDKSR